MTLRPSHGSIGMYVKLILLLILGLISYYQGDFFSTLPYVSVVFELLRTYLILHISLNLIASFVIFIYRKKNNRANEYKDNYTIGIEKLTRFCFVLIFILIFIDTALIDLKQLISSLAIAAFLIGLVFKDYLLNFLNGVDIMFSGKIKLGEYIKAGEEKGKVKDLTFSHVELLTDTKDVLYVPNSIIKSEQIINYSKNKVKNIFIEVTLDKSRFEYYTELERVLPKKIFKKFPDLFLDETKIRIHLDNLEREGVKWKIEYVVTKYSFEIENKLKNYTGKIIIEFFNHKDKLKAKKDIKEFASPSTPHSTNSD